VKEKYIISDAAKILEVEPHVLRYWEEELDIPIERNQLGHRYYTKENIELLKRIKDLKEQGFQLKAIKLLLNSTDKNELKDNSEVKKNDMLEVGELQPSSININKPSLSGDKLKQFQEFMKVIINDSLQESNKVLKEEISEEFKIMMKKQEEVEERRYRKFDEMIREMQKTRQEIALSNNKKSKSFFKKRKK